MKKLSGFQKKFLRGMAHHLEPIVMVGRNGVTKNVLKLADDALKSHELIKVRFVELKDIKKNLTEEISSKTVSEIVGMIGHVAILYRQNPDKEKRKINIPLR